LGSVFDQERRALPSRIAASCRNRWWVARGGCTTCRRAAGPAGFSRAGRPIGTRGLGEDRGRALVSADEMAERVSAPAGSGAPPRRRAFALGGRRRHYPRPCAAAGDRRPRPKALAQGVAWPHSPSRPRGLSGRRALSGGAADRVPAAALSYSFCFPVDRGAEKQFLFFIKTKPDRRVKRRDVGQGRRGTRS